MSQFIALLSKELGFWFRRPGVHLFALLFLSTGVMTMLALAGQIEFIQVGGMGGLKKADSVNQLTEMTLVWSLFATMNLAAAAGGAATRDVTEGSHPLVFSAPVGKSVFLGSRYVGALIVSAYLVAAIPVGLFLGRFVPGLEAERIGAFDPIPTLICIVIWIGPNVLFVTSLFFGIGALTRKMFPIYLGGVLLFVGYLGSRAFTADLDDHTIAVLMDPFGTRAIDDVTRYWSPEQTNTEFPWPSGRSLANRILWVVVGGVALFACTAMTRLDEHGWQPFARFSRKAEGIPETFDERLPVPVATRSFTTATRLSQLYRLCRRSVLDVVGHRYFWGFVGASVLFQLLNTQAIGAMYGTNTFPVTYQVLEVLFGTLQLFVVLVVTFYAGDLVWAERDNGQAQLLDSAPVPDWAPMFAKLLALGVLVVGLHLIPLVLGPLVQLASGYSHIEPGQYLITFVFALLDWIPFVALALCVHVVANHKMLGHVILIGLWIVQIFRQGLGFEHNLFWPGSDPGRVFSDMNGWGHSLQGFLTYKAYWAAFALLVAAIARVFWVRGSLPFDARIREARRRLDPVTSSALVVSGILTVLFAGIVVYQTNVVGTYRTTVDRNRLQASLEQTYKATWDDAPQPWITDIDTTVDLYPVEGRAEVQATFQLVNPHAVPIDEMMVSFSEKATVRSMALSIPYTEEIDEKHELSIWTLSRPLQPGERATMTFSTTYQQQGLSNSGFEELVVPSGTLLHHGEVFPTLGYERGWELSDPADRRKYDLPDRDRMRDLDDPRARMHNYITDDAQRVTFTAKVSTVRGQIPMAPGDLIDQGEDGDRVWRTYRPKDPALYLFAFLSADWVVTRSEDGPVPVEVYAFADHPYNVDRMIEGMNASIRMFERDFGPFQHEILRIVEFPRYATYAQSLPAMVPFSEAIGFIAQVDDPEEDIDYVYYVTAHEVAHQWWAHQVCGGDGQGATVLTESLSQYSAFKVMEEEYGEDQIQRFLEYEADRYFRGRSNERDEELPLIRVENQQYIHYQKGGIVFYVLSERIGREAFDGALRTFLDQWRLVGPSYPTARDLVDHLRSTFPDHAEAIADGFERIIRYDLRLDGVSIASAGDGHRVEMEITAERIVSDGEGRDTRGPLRDTVVVQAEDATGTKVTEVVAVDGTGSYTAVFRGLASPPVEIRLDPRALYLEQDRDDNERSPDDA